MTTPGRPGLNGPADTLGRCSNWRRLRLRLFRLTHAATRNLASSEVCKH
jgi:hypothetical protein